MKWTHKNIEIGINSEGRFFFNILGKDFSAKSLEEAKEIINKALDSYYTFNQYDIAKLLSKLNKREQELVKSLYHELQYHMNNSYCEIGIVQDEWKWDWDFNE